MVVDLPVTSHRDLRLGYRDARSGWRSGPLEAGERGHCGSFADGKARALGWSANGIGTGPWYFSL